MNFSVRKLTSFSKKEVSLLFGQVKRIFTSRSLTLLSAPALNRNYGRILIVIPRKVGTSPERNLIRRRIKSIFWERKLHTAVQDIIVLCRPGCSELTYAYLDKLLMHHIKIS